MCSDAPPPPDFTPLANAMEKIGNQMYSLGQQQLGFSQQQYQTNLPLYQKMVNSNLEGQGLAMDLARDAAKERLKYRALEDTIIQDAQTFNKQQQTDQFAGRAAADTQQALATQQGIANRNLTRMGINPNSGRFAQLNSQFALGGAGMTAGAKNNARFQADAMGRQITGNAAALGRNLPGQALSAVGTAGNLGGATSGLLNAQSAPMYQGFQGAMGGLQGQLGAVQGVGNMMNQGYQNQLAAYNADGGAMGALGQIGGMAMGYFMADGGVVGDDGRPDLNQDGQGGQIHGPGTGTSDSVQAINTSTGAPVHLSNGEYIIKAERVRELGKDFFDSINEGRKPSDGRRRKAIRKG